MSAAAEPGSAGHGGSTVSGVDDELVEEFLAEAREHVDGLDSDLVALERDPGDGELLARIFRRVHTVKGAAGFLGFAMLETLTHAGEDLLDRLRNGELAVDRTVTDGLLALADALRAVLDDIARTGQEGDDHDAMVARLRTLRHADQRGPAARDGGRGSGGTDPVSDGDDGSPRLGDILVERGVIGVEDVEEALVEQDRRSLMRSDTSIRVETAALDELMNLTGELVLARNALVAAADTGHARLGSAVQRLDRVATELQAAVTETRMQPISWLWRRLPRVVRDLAATCGKRVRVDFSGSETELDKAVLETIRDPLTHLVRNAVDHGIEPPDVRRAAGKPPEGVVSLRAFHEYGRVNIEVHDDGAGIDVERLAATFRRAFPGREPPADPDALLDVVFTPGLSTADEVTSVSGRGVGMDVVRTQVDRIGGTVDLASTPGEGTTTTIRVPLTTAIMPAIVVRAGAERYAVAQVDVGEAVVVVDAAAVERVHDAEGLRHRGALLPLVRLADLLGTSDHDRRSRRRTAPHVGDGARSAGDVEASDGVVTALVVEAAGRFALAVDAVSDVAEIVV